MASKGQWKGKGVVGGAHLAKSLNPPSKGARKGKRGSLSKSQDQAAKEAPREGKGKGGDSLNDNESWFAHLAKSLNPPSKVERKGKGGSLSKSQDQSANEVARGDSLNDHEPRFDHDHAECIKERELEWGTPSDSDSDSPLSPSLADALFPLLPPELEARLNEAEQLRAQKARTIHRIEFQKLLDALEARELASSTSRDLVNSTA